MLAMTGKVADITGRGRNIRVNATCLAPIEASLLTGGVYTVHDGATAR